jgi:hypothetical protein
MIDDETKRKLIRLLENAPDLPHWEHEPVRFDYYIKLYYYDLLKNATSTEEKNVL